MPEQTGLRGTWRATGFSETVVGLTPPRPLQASHVRAAAGGGNGQPEPPASPAPLGGGVASAGGTSGVSFALMALLACLGLALPALSRLVDTLRQRGAPLAFVLPLDRPG